MLVIESMLQQILKYCYDLEDMSFLPEDIQQAICSKNILGKRLLPSTIIIPTLHDTKYAGSK